MSLRLNKYNKEEILNKPTEVDNEIFKYFEHYESSNVSKNPNSNFFKKKGIRKFNLINLTNSSNQITDDNKINQDEPHSKKINFTYDQKGLDDNYFNDLENKRKAKLGLLMIMNKYSGGEFCKEVKTYFDKARKIEEEKNKNKEENKKENEVKKTFARQKCIELFDDKDCNKNTNLNNSNNNNPENYSNKLYKVNLDLEFMQNKTKQNFPNIKLLNEYSEEYINFMQLYRYPIVLGCDYYLKLLGIGD